MLNLVIAFAINIDPAMIAFYIFVPVGTFALCALACSGFIHGCSTGSYLPDAADLVFLMIVSIGAIVLAFLVEYVYAMLGLDVAAAPTGGFSRFVLTRITESQVYIITKETGIEGPYRTGEGGFLTTLVRLAGAAAIAKMVHSSMVSRAINLS